MKYSLFIGRYQPLHVGHITIIRKVLDEGKNVCIALRNTDKDEHNPYSVAQRRRMFKKEFLKEMRQGKVIIRVIPDIEAVCYGRKVGYGIREIRVSKDIENISATKIRAYDKNKH